MHAQTLQRESGSIRNSGAFQVHLVYCSPDSFWHSSSPIKLFPQVIISRVINHTYAYRKREASCVYVSLRLWTETERDEGKIENSDSVVIWKMMGYLYNLAVTRPSSSLRVNLVKRRQRRRQLPMLFGGDRVSSCLKDRLECWGVWWDGVWP